MRFGRKRLFMLSAAALLTAVLTLLSFAGCDELGLYGDAMIQEAQQLIEITDSEKSAPDTEAVTAGEAEAVIREGDDLFISALAGDAAALYPAEIAVGRVDAGPVPRIVDL